MNTIIDNIIKLICVIILMTAVPVIVALIMVFANKYTDTGSNLNQFQCPKGKIYRS